uniref:Uncharacterized protein n=1 Tax=Timema monikensis TaxID=170555 RepID=A0A7R9EK07_9NEOP|nr:unnamed protein product [Timema monikensis]
MYSPFANEALVMYSQQKCSVRQHTQYCLHQLFSQTQHTQYCLHQVFSQTTHPTLFSPGVQSDNTPSPISTRFSSDNTPSTVSTRCSVRQHTQHCFHQVFSKTQHTQPCFHQVFSQTTHPALFPPGVQSDNTPSLVSTRCSVRQHTQHCLHVFSKTQHTQPCFHQVFSQTTHPALFPPGVQSDNTPSTVSMCSVRQHTQHCFHQVFSQTTHPALFPPGVQSDNTLNIVSTRCSVRHNTPSTVSMCSVRQHTQHCLHVFSQTTHPALSPPGDQSDNTPSIVSTRCSVRHTQHCIHQVFSPDGSYIDWLCWPTDDSRADGNGRDRTTKDDVTARGAELIEESNHVNTIVSGREEGIVDIIRAYIPPPPPTASPGCEEECKHRPVNQGNKSYLGTHYSPITPKYKDPGPPRQQELSGKSFKENRSLQESRSLPSNGSQEIKSLPSNGSQEIKSLPSNGSQEIKSLPCQGLQEKRK